MKFPIDVVYFNRRKKVRKIRRAMMPWRMSACLFAHSVLELPAGSITRTETCVGEQLRFECGGDGGESALPEPGVPEEHAGSTV